MNEQPWRVRFRIPFTVLPAVVGIGTAAVLWNDTAELGFFDAAAHVLAIGAVGMALTGHFFRLSIHRDEGAAGAYVIFNVLFLLVATGIGLGFSFGALATGHARAHDLALVAGSLSAGISAFAIQALFGTPGLLEDRPPDAAP